METRSAMHGMLPSGYCVPMDLSVGSKPALCHRVFGERQCFFKSQGYRKAVMRNRFEKEQLGVFMPIMDACKQLICDYGWMGNIISPKEIYVQGERVFSSVLNAYVACEEYKRAHTDGRKLLLFSLYCDATMLAKSGVDDGTFLRIRLENVDGISTCWHDIGIAPSFDTGY